MMTMLRSSGYSCQQPVGRSFKLLDLLTEHK